MWKIPLATSKTALDDGWTFDPEFVLHIAVIAREIVWPVHMKDVASVLVALRHEGYIVVETPKKEE